MATRGTLRNQLQNRLSDPDSTIWAVDELNDYIDQAIQSLYPYWPVHRVGTTVGGPGPIQPVPSGCKNIYFVGVRGATSTRVRTIRGWREGKNECLVPKVNVEGLILAWAWTEPIPAPTDDLQELDLPPQAEEVVLLRAHITALERLLTDRIRRDKYFSLFLREGITENEIVATLEALHASVDRRLERAPQPPERVG